MDIDIEEGGGSSATAESSRSALSSLSSSRPASSPSPSPSSSSSWSSIPASGPSSGSRSASNSLSRSLCVSSALDSETLLLFLCLSCPTHTSYSGRLRRNLVSWLRNGALPPDTLHCLRVFQTDTCPFFRGLFGFPVRGFRDFLKAFALLPLLAGTYPGTGTGTWTGIFKIVTSLLVWLCRLPDSAAASRAVDSEDLGLEAGTVKGLGITVKSMAVAVEVTSTLVLTVRSPWILASTLPSTAAAAVCPGDMMFCSISLSLIFPTSSAAFPFVLLPLETETLFTLDTSLLSLSDSSFLLRSILSISS